MKQLIGVMMAALLAFSLTLPVSAAAEAKRTIQISKVDGTDVTMTKGTAKSFTAKADMKLSDISAPIASIAAFALSSACG